MQIASKSTKIFDMTTLLESVPPEIARPAPTAPKAEVKPVDKKGRHRRGYKPHTEDWFTRDQFYIGPAGTKMSPEKHGHRHAKEPSNGLEFMQNREAIETQFRSFLGKHAERMIGITDKAILRDPELALDKLVYDAITTTTEKEIAPGNIVSHTVVDQTKLTKFLSSAEGVTTTMLVLEQEIIRRGLAVGLKMISDPSGERMHEWQLRNARILTGLDQGVINKLYHDYVASQFQPKNLVRTGLVAGFGGVGFLLSGGNPLGAAAGVGALAALNSGAKSGVELLRRQFGAGLDYMKNSPALCAWADQVYHVSLDDFVSTLGGGIDYAPRVPRTTRLVSSETTAVSPPLTISDELQELITTRQEFYKAGHIPTQLIDASALQFLMEDDVPTHLRPGRRHSPVRGHHQMEKTGAKWQRQIRHQFDRLGGFQYLPSPPYPPLTPDQEGNLRRGMEAIRIVGIETFNRRLLKEAAGTEPGKTRQTALEAQIKELETGEGEAEGSIIKERRKEHNERHDAYKSDKEVLAGAEGTPGGERQTFEAWRTARNTRDQHVLELRTKYGLTPADVLDEIKWRKENYNEYIDAADDAEIERDSELIRLRRVESNERAQMRLLSGKEMATQQRAVTDAATQVATRRKSLEDDIKAARRQETTDIQTLYNSIQTDEGVLKTNGDIMSNMSTLRQKIQEDHDLVVTQWGIDPTGLTFDQFLDAAHTAHIANAAHGWSDKEDFDPLNRRRMLHAYIGATTDFRNPSDVLSVYDEITAELDRNIESERYQADHISADDEIDARNIAVTMIKGRERIAQRFDTIRNAQDLQVYVDTSTVAPGEEGYFDAERARYDNDGNPIPAGTPGGHQLPKGYLRILDDMLDIHNPTRIDKNEFITKIIKHFPPGKFAELLNNYGGLPLALTPIGTPPRFNINEALTQLGRGYDMNLFDKADLRSAMNRIIYRFADEVIASLN